MSQGLSALTLKELANSRRHLLLAEWLMSDRIDRAETDVRKLAETMKELAELTDIVSQWYERHGNGQHPS